LNVLHLKANERSKWYEYSVGRKHDRCDEGEEYDERGKRGRRDEQNQRNGSQMFGGAQGFDARNAEFNNVGGDMNKSACESSFMCYNSNSVDICCLDSGKNFAFTEGNVQYQNFGNVRLLAYM